LDFIFFRTDYQGFYRVYLKPQHLVKYGHLLVTNNSLRLVVDIDQEKGEMYLHSAESDTQSQPAEKA
jgi:hypothetical protein